jgi:hypothetical protein
MRGCRMKRLPSPSFALIAVLTVVISVIILLVSPLILLLVNKLFILDWSLLSNIGQSYTGVSALLSAGAFIAVAITVWLQAKQTRLIQQQATRTMQFELLRMALAQPELYGPIVNGPMHQSNSDHERQYLFTTLWIQYARFAYQTGEIGEDLLRSEFFALTFASEEGRRWYRTAFPYWVQFAGNDQVIGKFVSMMQEEYDKTVAYAPSPDPPTSDNINSEEA